MSRTDFSVTVEDTLKVKLSNIHFVTKIVTDGNSISQREDGTLESIGVTDGQGSYIGYEEIKSAVERKSSTAYVFDTYNNFLKWIDGTYIRLDGLAVSKLNLGDEIWIKEKSVPDYWYSDDTTKPITIKNFSAIESEQKKLTSADVGAVASVSEGTEIVGDPIGGIAAQTTFTVENSNGKELVMKYSTTDDGSGLPSEKEMRITMHGRGDKFLSDNGEYKEVLGGSSFDLSQLPQFTNKIEINMGNASSLAGLLTLPIAESSNIYVNWGDGTGTHYAEATTEISHQYEDASFIGWITVYGDFNGIKFIQNISDENKKIITSLEYDVNITKIEDYGLTGCSNLYTIKISDNFTTLGIQAFTSTTLRSFIMSPSLVSINRLAFKYCTNLKKFEMNHEIDTLYSEFFNSCSTLTELKLSNKLAYIQSSVFKYCAKLQKLHFPNTLRQISGSQPFHNCSSLTELEFDGNVPTIESDIFNGYGVNVKNVIVPYNYLRNFKTGTNITQYADRIYPKGGIYSETVTIPVANWVDNAQTVEVVGSTNEARNHIEFVLVDADGKQVEDTYGLTATQGTMQMTFSCETVPTEDIHVYVISTLTNY